MGVEQLDRDRLFVALTRPLLLLGVPFSFAVLNGVVTTELFLIFKSIWVLGVALVLHLVGAAVTVADSHAFDLWLTKVRHCPRVPNYRLWRCNSYRP